MFGPVQPEQRHLTSFRTRGRLRIPALTLVGVMFCWLGSVSAAETPVTESADRPDYSTSTHQQLTELGARWDELSDSERRALLREVKLRMAQSKDADGVLMIRTQRRYGRIYRHADGRVLRIETQVVQVRPVEQGDGNSGFGVGYERRTAEVPEAGWVPEAGRVAEAGDVPESSDMTEAGSLQRPDKVPPTILANDPSRH